MTKSNKTKAAIGAAAIGSAAIAAALLYASKRKKKDEEKELSFLDHLEELRWRIV